MEVSAHSSFFLVALSIICACASAIPTVQSRDDLGQPRRDPTQSRSWSGILRGPRRASVPSRFDTQLVDLNRNPAYYNYHTLPEEGETEIRSAVGISGLRLRRSPQGFGSRYPFRDVDAGLPRDDYFRRPSFRDEQPRQPERTAYSDYSRTGCIDGGASCNPKPQRKYFDFYS